jgi:predicted MPP superfamily phosphohydrolase
MNWKKGKRYFGFAVAVILLGLAAYGFLVEPNWIEVTHVWISSPRLSKALDGKLAIHLSDLHISRIGKREEEVLRLLMELKPDFVFLTGDYVKWQGDCEAALTFFSRLEAKIEVWAVMGDYDYSNSRKSCLFCHEPNTGNPTKKHPVKFLRNDLEKIEIDGTKVWLGGIDGQGNRQGLKWLDSCFARCFIDFSLQPDT